MRSLQKISAILSLLADEVSLAIENTRLLESTRRSLSEAEALYRQYLRQAWSRFPHEENLVGYHYTISGSAPLESSVDFDTNSKGENKEQKETEPPHCSDQIARRTDR